jgi:hypothetical protein
MRREIVEVDLFDLSRPPAGSVPVSVRLVVGGAALAVVAVAAVAARGIWQEDGHAMGLDAFWFQNGLALAIAAALGAAALPHPRVSRFVRLAALLPVVLLAGMLVAWAGWELIAPRLLYLRNHAPLVFEMPVAMALGAMLVMTCLAALAVERRRLDAWIRTLVVISLVELLVLGLWLPLVSSWWPRHETVGWVWTYHGRLFLIGPRLGLLALTLVPPLVVATAFAVAAARWPVLVRRGRRGLAMAVGLLFLIALSVRVTASGRAAFVYLNLSHFFAASVFVAAVALVALVGSLWWRGRLARRRIARERAPVTGVIPGEPHGPGGVVACLELEGWLSGARPLVASFEVATPAGRLPIPIGAELAASVPAVSTVLHVGESVAILRRGDRVVVGGLVVPDADHPFRSSAALVPGPSGVVVRRQDDEDDGFTTVSLVAWRPCVAFLAILTAIAIPGLVTVLTMS